MSINRDNICTTGIIPAGYQLITDSRPFVVKDIKRGTLSESTEQGKVGTPVMRVTGVFQEADKKNANGRIYPKAVLKDAIERLQPSIKSRSVMGEFDHPPDAKIHMDRVSHIITKLWMDNDTVLGEAEVMNDDRMPCGAMLECLLDRKVQVGVSSRGVGDMDLTMHEGEEAYEVKDGYSIVTFDAVAEPSVTNAQLKLMESLIRGKKHPKEYQWMREELLLRQIRMYLSK